MQTVLGDICLPVKILSIKFYGFLQRVLPILYPIYAQRLVLLKDISFSDILYSNQAHISRCVFLLTFFLSRRLSKSAD